MKIVIFDFNRTVYDPKLKKLVPGAKLVLSTLKNRGFSLYLVSHGEFCENIIFSLGINKYFKDIVVSKEKRRKDFEEIITKENIDINSSFVVGDRVRKEITFGNLLGLKTIWVRVGKFANELPRTTSEEPKMVVDKLIDILMIVH